MPSRARFVAAAALSCALTGCGGIPPEPFVVGQAAQASPEQTAETLGAQFAEFAAEHPGDVALAWAPVGAPDAVQSLGSTADVDAWSTIKVPIAVAVAARNDGQLSERDQRLVTAAIGRSDNDAAVALWANLGGVQSASDLVEAELRVAGDDRTEVAEDAAGKNRGFGRTAWRVDDAARFAAILPCEPDAARVYAAMAQIDRDHQWGLGSVLGPRRFKGGWGPSDHGYLVRQLGVVETSQGGQVAVALAVQPENGRHDTAVASATALASWLTTRLGPTDAGTCSG